MNIAEQIADYAHDLDGGRLPPLVVHRVKQRMVDSLACALGAYGSVPARAATAMAATVPVPAASVLGTRLRTTPDLAAFANGTLVRYLDYNDGYMSRDPGHPSDNIPACLAVAEAEGVPGHELIAAIVLAYEVQMRLQDAAGLNRRGWDHVNYILVSMAAAASRLMKLDRRQTVQAINMALNGHIAMRQVRSANCRPGKAAPLPMPPATPSSVPGWPAMVWTGRRRSSRARWASSVRSAARWILIFPASARRRTGTSVS